MKKRKVDIAMDDGITEYSLEPTEPSLTTVERGRKLLRMFEQEFKTNKSMEKGMVDAGLEFEWQLQQITDMEAGHRPPEMTDLEIGIEYGVAYERLRVWLRSTAVDRDIRMRNGGIKGTEAYHGNAEEKAEVRENMRAAFAEFQKSHPYHSKKQCCEEVGTQFEVSYKTIERAIK
jgi:hypothetical protein